MIMRNRPMKKPNRTIKWILLAPVILILSCTDLTENVNNQVTAENFFKTDEEFISALGDAYGALTQYGGNFAVNMLAEVPSDEIVVGHKGADWEIGRASGREREGESGVRG